MLHLRHLLMKDISHIKWIRDQPKFLSLPHSSRLIFKKKVRAKLKEKKLTLLHPHRKPERKMQRASFISLLSHSI